MQFLSGTPTKNYFISIFVMVAALFCVFSITVYHYHSRFERLNAWTLYDYETARQSRRLLFDLVDMETGMRGYLLTGQPKFLKPYDAARARLDEHIRKLWEFTKGDRDAHEDIDAWLVRMEKFATLLQKQVELRERGGKGAVSLASLDKQREEMDALRLMMDKNIQDRLKRLQSQIDATQEKRQNFKYILVIGTVLAIGGMMLATMIVIALVERSEKAEKEVGAAEERMLKVMHGIGDGLFDFSLANKTIYYSPAYKAMLGYRDDEHPDTLETFTQLLHPDDQEHALEKYLQNPPQDPQTYSKVIRMRNRDGTWHWILARGVWMRGMSGKVVRLIGTHTDITEQKQREDELEQLNNEMETFSYITSHDLRSPLVNLKGFAGEMERGLEVTKPILDKIAPTLDEKERETLKLVFEEEMPESLHFIKQAVVRMDALTTSVLNISTIGKRVYRFVQVDTQAMVKRCLDALNYEITQKNIEVTCGNLPPLVCDALTLEQIFSNILDNAVKYTDVDTNGKIEIEAKIDGPQVIFSVRDTGRGIQEEDREKIFQIFRRARNTNNVRGLGIGMTFVQASLRRLGGAIWFDSAPGEGTTFYFRLPLRTMTTREEAD